MPQISRQLPGTPSKPNGPKPGGVISRLSSAWETSPTLKMLVYGKSGVGKTTLWATFPKPLLALVVSGGSQPGELKSVDTQEYRKSITPVVISKTSDIMEVLQEASEYATVVLDHASGLQDQVLKELLHVDQLPAQKGWGLASQQMWGQCTQQCKEILRALLSLKNNVVIVAQERIFNDKDEGSSDVIAPSVGAGLTPSLTGWLGPACDYVVQAYIRQKEKITTTIIGKGKDAQTIEQVEVVPGEVEYCLRTAPSPVFQTKFRIPRGRKLPGCIVDPSYGKIMALIKGEVEADDVE